MKRKKKKRKETEIMVSSSPPRKVSCELNIFNGNWRHKITILRWNVQQMPDMVRWLFIALKHLIYKMMCVCVCARTTFQNVYTLIQEPRPVHTTNPKPSDQGEFQAWLRTLGRTLWPSLSYQHLIFFYLHLYILQNKLITPDNYRKKIFCWF